MFLNIKIKRLLKKQSEEWKEQQLTKISEIQKTNDRFIKDFLDPLPLNINYFTPKQVLEFIIVYVIKKEKNITNSKYFDIITDVELFIDVELEKEKSKININLEPRSILEIELAEIDSKKSLLVYKLEFKITKLKTELYDATNNKKDLKLVGELLKKIEILSAKKDELKANKNFQSDSNNTQTQPNSQLVVEETKQKQPDPIILETNVPIETKVSETLSKSGLQKPEQQKKESKDSSGRFKNKSRKHISIEEERQEKDNSLIQINHKEEVKILNRLDQEHKELQQEKNELQNQLKRLQEQTIIVIDQLQQEHEDCDEDLLAHAVDELKEYVDEGQNAASGTQGINLVQKEIKKYEEIKKDTELANNGS